MAKYEKHTERVHLRLTPTARKKLDILSQKSKLTLSKTIEQLIEGNPIREAPPLEFYRLCEEMRAIGRNFNQLVHRAHLNGDVNLPEYRQQAEEIQKAVFDIWRAVLSR
ncbi:hypothetical protein LJC04_03635 [Ruminococcaceae bacterium OttesenSCG-928-O06]|nr:hypothetical protein [Ruminococcaceae bacterium OttesenSCG-928-O06]